MAHQKMPGILIVDDDSDFHELVRRYLEGKSRRFAAYNHREAMRLLETEFVDIVLVDIRLGEEKGFSVARKIKKEYPDTIVYLMSDAVRDMRTQGREDIECIEKTIPVRLMIDQALHFWKLKNLPDDLKRRKDAIVSRLSGSGNDRVEMIFRRESEGVETLVGSIPWKTGQQVPHYIKWLVYRYPQHPGIVDIGITPTLGCSGRCRMCLSGRSRPFIRRLSTSEILSQVALGLDSALAEGYLTGENKVSVNWTCEGEFTDNVENSCNAIKTLQSINEIEFKVIITTIGKPTGLGEFMDRWIMLPVDFYWSVHSVIRNKREWLMPGTIGQSMEKTREIFSEFSRLTGRRITAAMSIAKGFNDSKEDVAAWIDFFKGWPVDTKVMIMTDHCLPDYTGKVTTEDVSRIVDTLNDHGIPSRLRGIMGSEALSGCGTTVPDFDRLIVSTKIYDAL